MIARKHEIIIRVTRKHQIIMVTRVTPSDPYQDPELSRVIPIDPDHYPYQDPE